MILRITYFKWGDSCNNWYLDMEEVQRQLLHEMNREVSPDITHTDWYEAKRIEIPIPNAAQPKE